MADYDFAEHWEHCDRCFRYAWDTRLRSGEHDCPGELSMLEVFVPGLTKPMMITAITPSGERSYTLRLTLDDVEAIRELTEPIRG